MQQAEAQGLAGRVMDWMLDNPDQLGAFMAATGLGPADLRAGLGTPGLDLALIDHLMGDEGLLTRVCADLGLPPDHPARAQAALGGGPGPNWT